MRHPHIAATDGQADGGKLRQGDRLGLTIPDLRPGLDHILLHKSLVTEINSSGIHRILHTDMDCLTFFLYLTCRNKDR